MVPLNPPAHIFEFWKNGAHHGGGKIPKEHGDYAFSSRGVLLNEEPGFWQIPAGYTTNQTDGIIAGWYLSCKGKGYTVFCLNNPDHYCLYNDVERGEFQWYTTQYLRWQGVYLPPENFPTGLISTKIGWHMFAVSFKSFDRDHDEMS